MVQKQAWRIKNYGYVGDVSAIKSQILPDFTAEWLELQSAGPPDLSSVWTMYFDGSKRIQGT
jgi:hypothetical protein